MSDKKISQLTAATTPLVGTEVLPIVQGTTTVKVANNDLRPKQIQSNATSGVLQVTGPASDATRVMTTPDANFTVARTDVGQTFSGDQQFQQAVIVTGGITGHGASRTTVSQEGPNGAYLQNYGADASTKGKLTVRLASSDFSLTSVPAVFDGDNISCPNGNFVVGTSGKGIDFSATAGTGTSELLADYEEGTWTPAYSADDGNPTVTYTVQQGKYVKIGNMVYVSCGLVINTTSGGSGALRIYGLPYAAGSDTIAGLSNAFVWNFATNPQQYNISAGLDSILLYTSTFTNTVATAASLQNGAYLYISGCYRTN